jgi:hypothetical protein
MNANAEKWIAALRSGKFLQGKDYLKVDGKYCCLGVACELAIADGLAVTTGIERTHDGRTAELFDGEKFYLPLSVQEWLRLETNTGNWSPRNKPVLDDNVAYLNDKGRTFEEIAEFVKTHEKELFVSAG